MADRNLVVIQTKLVPPVRETGLVARKRLITRLSNSTDQTLVVVKAPAGYGKTIFAGQWFAALDPAVELAGWYSLDTADNDLGRFFTYLVAALQLKVESFGATVLAQLNAGVRPSSASLSGAFLNEIAVLDRQVSIVLDDFHILDNTEITDAIGQIVSNAPANLRMLISSREIPQLPLGRLRALGRLVEINSEELRFRRTEIGSFMSLAGHPGLSAGQIYSLEKHTEGWAAGLQLASISLLNRDDVDEFISTFSGGYRGVADFLAEDVLQRQDEEIRQFLLQTSILERLSPALCNAVTGTENGRRMLDILESKSLFLFSLDDESEWYRYHHLFSEFLRKYLNTRHPDRVMRLHTRASDWFAGHDFIEEAIQHALAGQDTERAAQLLEKACDDLFYSGRLSTLAEWYKQIPEENLNKCPRVLLDQAWSEILEWKFSVADGLLDRVRAILEEKETTGDPESELVYLFPMLKHREMMYALFRDDVLLVEHSCEKILQDFPVTDPYLKGNLYTCLIYAQREMFNFSDVNRFDALSLQLYEEADSRFVLIWHNSILGPTELERGDLDRAEEALALGRSIAREISGELSPLAAMPGILLAEVFYERNQLDEADTLLEQYLPLASQTGFVDQLIAGYTCRARRLIAVGAGAEAKRVLREAEALAVKQGFTRFGMSIKAEYARQALLDRDFETAKNLFQDIFGQAEAKSFYPVGRVTSLDATRALTWCRLARFEGFGDAASLICRKWIHFADKRKAVRTATQFSVLLALILKEQGDLLASMRALRQALSIAKSGGFIRTIIDGMVDDVILLGKFIDGQCLTDDPLLVFANQLMEIISAERGIGIPIPQVSQTESNLDMPMEPLSEREREILQMVANGLLNREVANSLSLTEGSVKWHLQQIYDKLGTRRRAQAVQRAKNLGLIQ